MEIAAVVVVFEISLYRFTICHSSVWHSVALYCLVWFVSVVVESQTMIPKTGCRPCRLGTISFCSTTNTYSKPLYFQFHFHFCFHSRSLCLSIFRHLYFCLSYSPNRLPLTGHWLVGRPDRHVYFRGVVSLWQSGMGR